MSTKRFLALGDSYTIGECVGVEACWPTRLADAGATLGLRLVGIVERKEDAATRQIAGSGGPSLPAQERQAGKCSCQYAPPSR